MLYWLDSLILTFSKEGIENVLVSLSSFLMCLCFHIAVVHHLKISIPVNQRVFKFWQMIIFMNILYNDKDSIFNQISFYLHHKDVLFAVWAIKTFRNDPSVNIYPSYPKT